MHSLAWYLSPRADARQAARVAFTFLSQLQRCLWCSSVDRYLGHWQTKMRLSGCNLYSHRWQWGLPPFVVHNEIAKPLPSRCFGASASMEISKKIEIKTYNRRDSQMVTHSSTSRPVQCLCMAERTGCPVFTDLWSYVMTVVRS